MHSGLNFSLAALLGLALVSSTWAADPVPPQNAGDLAAQLSQRQQDGNSYIRLRLELPAAANNVLQLQIKSRNTAAGSDLVYQVIWPKERKGEAVLLRRGAHRPATGTTFTPPDSLHPIDAAQMRQPFFGSDLAYEDLVENFFAWDQQALVGTETVDRIPCQILESKPGANDHSTYASVRTWVDTRRLVPLRVEKYAKGGKLVRRIDTDRVATDDKDRVIPAYLTVHGPNGTTSHLDGSKIKHGVTYTDDDFTPQSLQKPVN